MEGNLVSLGNHSSCSWQQQAGRLSSHTIRSLETRHHCPLGQKLVDPALCNSQEVMSGGGLKSISFLEAEEMAQLLLLEKTPVRFPASMWRLITISNSRSRESSILFVPPSPSHQAHTQCTHIHLKHSQMLNTFQTRKSGFSHPAKPGQFQSSSWMPQGGRFWRKV